MSEITIAIAGNPNCGKTTLFNALTGARQKVGNWPGVTVERKTGECRDELGTVQIVDLPGTYSLGVQIGGESLDERVARNFLAMGQADVVVNILDASNLERNLYLTAQLLELNIPMVVALNKMDIVAKRNIQIDEAALSSQLGCPVVAMSVTQNWGVGGMMAAVRQTEHKTNKILPVIYPATIETAISQLESKLPVLDGFLKEEERHWLAIKILEGDNLQGLNIDEDALSGCLEIRRKFEENQGEDADLLIASARFAFANRVTTAVAQDSPVDKSPISDFIDKVVLNRAAGPFVFLGLIYLMFMFTINLGGAFIDFFDLAAAAIFVDGFGELLTAIGLPDWMRVLLADGVGGGIQVVATFIPIIGFLYLFLAMLEDSGYMARAAFLMDRLMRKIGLPGKSFVPLIVGFGCNVPAIMATRTLDQQRDRIMAAMMAPFMSCGARLAVYALFAAAFFPTGGQNIVFALYLIGIAAAIATGVFLKKTVLQGAAPHFIMELPPYNLPRPKDVLISTWVRLKSFMLGAGKIIVIVVAILTVMNSLGKDGSFGNEDSENSILSEVGKLITPILSPLGVSQDNWPAAVGVFTGIFAKEAVVGTLDALYSNMAVIDAGKPETEEIPFNLADGLMEAYQTIPENFAGLSDLLLDPLGLEVANVNEGVDGVVAELELTDGTLTAMASRFDGRIGAFAYLLFILLYTPCVAALGAINRELGAKWTTFATLWTTAFAFGLSICFYQIARFDRAPTTASLWLGGITAAILFTFIAMRWIGNKDNIQNSMSGTNAYAFTSNHGKFEKGGARVGRGLGKQSCH